MKDRAELDRIDRALAGLLSDAELAAFRADVVRDAALRAAYVERAWLDSLLRAERDQLPQLLEPSPARFEPAPARSRTRHRTTALLAFAGLSAAAAIAFTLGFRRGAIAPPTIARLTEATNTRWAGSTLPTTAGSRLSPGTLALVEGIAIVSFSNGAALTLEAPTTLEIVSPLHTRLIEGSIIAHIPPAAHGFTVETAELKVVDLGTRFGVTASSTGNSHVFVFDGEVKLDSPFGAELRRLTAGQSYHFRSNAVAASAVEPSRPQTLEHIDGWTSISTSFGRGKDTFTRRGIVIPEPQPLLMVKHSDLPLSYKNERRAFLTFDLAGIRPAMLTEAELVLDPEPSGHGFSTMVLDARFAIYGVIDESRDTWAEHNLTWPTAPFADDAPDPARLRRLAEFDLPRGASGAPFTIRSAALVEFLRTDTNGLATLVVVRETGETEPSGLVHAFASKEHPTARPPTLRVR
jgi:ferric-dicitrate binding protein FerR (iron transport regulator)